MSRTVRLRAALILASVSLSGAEHAQDLDTQQQYETGRALAITGTVLQPFLAGTASLLVAAGTRPPKPPEAEQDATEDGAEGEPTLEVPYEPKRAFIAGGMVVRAVSAFGTPALQHFGALQSDNAFSSLGTGGQPELAYVGLALQSISGVLSLTSDGLTLREKPGPVNVALDATAGGLSFASWIISIVHIENNRVAFDAVTGAKTMDTAQQQRSGPWAGPEVLVHTWTLPSGTRLGLLVGSGVGITGTL